MSGFRIGQRVVFIDVSGPDLDQGSVGTIVRPHERGWWVCFDSPRRANQFQSDGAWMCMPSRIRPLDDDSRQLSTWDAVAEHTKWRPSPVTARGVL